ncbi:ABC transporter substrate-binding protein [Brevibacillus sp. SYSU BS000544]|uniref:ABC transporter substrate-binding protein n=1 Tax=Brevibacillus sp. SYSU BS000544 TaxID=3416443 RepID=UPI003CE4607B
MAILKHHATFVRIMIFISIIFLTACTGEATTTTNQTPPASSGEKPTETSLEITHSMGKTKLPKKPEKVITLDNGALDNLMALGVKPIGAATAVADQPFPAYIKNVDGIQNIGTIDQPNLESIAALQPDIILGSKDTHEAIYDKLSQIAPTVFVETLGATWKDNLKLQAEAVGKSKEAEQLLTDYNKRLEEFKAKMGDQLTKTHVSLLRPRKDNITVYLKQNFSGSIVQDAGLPRPAAQNKDEFTVKLNEEKVADMEGDVIIWFTRDKENLLNTKITANPTWKGFQAVKDNKVFEVSSETWLSGLGYQAANLVLDDLFAHLVK